MTFPLQGLGSRIVPDVQTQSVKQFGISPVFVYSKIEKDVYYLKFNNMCFTNQIVPGVLTVDNDVLKSKMINWLKPDDRKYIKLVSCNTQYSIFAFDADVWLEDSLKNSTNSIIYTTFQKSYKLSQQLPYLIRVYGLNMIYEKYIADTFKKKLKNNTNTRQDILSMITGTIKKVVSIEKLNCFEYKYVYQSNTVNVSLKPIFYGIALAAIAKLANKKQTKETKNFDKTVEFFLKTKR